MCAEPSPVPSRIAPCRPRHVLRSASSCWSAGVAAPKTTGYATRLATTAQKATCGGCSVSSSPRMAKAVLRRPESGPELPSAAAPGPSRPARLSSSSASRESLESALHFAKRNTAVASRHSRTRPRPSRSARSRSSCSSRRFLSQEPWPSAMPTWKRPSGARRGLGSCERQSRRKASARATAGSNLGARAPRSEAAAVHASTSRSLASPPAPAAALRSTAAAPSATASPWGMPGHQSLSNASA
mmetsp:Transcript_65241/g.194529  ORF Transcript_65241/g.194529 Transcript_65241/m.194529 type:complete len:243 (+) Transcript_65241:265-993(+)